ncbi:hypothetical protein [Hymenobacter wooponensis]|nr:hypothetical protein [Hymenobacter wooponensis]
MRKPEANTSGTLLGNSAYIFLIRFFPTLASVAALVWLSRHMAPTYYGRYQSFWVQWQVLQVVACLGLPTVILTYPAALVNSLVRGISRLQLCLLITSLMLVAGGFAVLQWQSSSPFEPWQTGGFLLLSVLGALLEAYALLGRQFRSLSLISVAYAGAFMLGHIFLVGQVLTSQQLMSMLLFCNVLRVAALSRLAQQHFDRVAAVVPSPFKAVRQLWLHTALNDGVQILFRWIDKFMLNFLLPPALFALYFNGTLDVPFLPLLLGAAGSGLLLHFGQPNIPDTERVTMLKEVGTVLGSLVFPLFFFLLYFRYELFGVVFAHRYDAAVPLFLVSGLVIPLRAYNFTAMLQHKSQGRAITKGAILDLLLALLLMYPLYRLLGLAGVALAFVISTYCQAAYYLALTAKLLRVSWVELLPWKMWASQLFRVGIGLLVVHELLARVVPEVLVVLIGSGLTCLLGLYLFYNARQRAQLQP